MKSRAGEPIVWREPRSTEFDPTARSAASSHSSPASRTRSARVRTSSPQWARRRPAKPKRSRTSNSVPARRGGAGLVRKFLGGRAWMASQWCVGPPAHMMTGGLRRFRPSPPPALGTANQGAAVPKQVASSGGGTFGQNIPQAPRHTTAKPPHTPPRTFWPNVPPPRPTRRSLSGRRDPPNRRATGYALPNLLALFAPE